MIRSLLALLLVATMTAQEVPAWVLRGILMEESSSTYNANGTIDYVNRQRGKYDERGPFQVSPSTFALYAYSGERIEQLEKDTVFAERFTKRILLDNFASTKSWILALSIYHRGRVCKTGKNYGHRIAWLGHNPQ